MLSDEAGLTHFDRLLRPDQSVRVIAGPFAGALGRLERLNTNGRVLVLLEIMGGQVEATINRAALQAA